MNPIVGIGEVLWDVYPDGRKVAGGAPFNFAFHCRQLGHPAVIVSRVGDDEPGRELRARVRELGLSDEFIQTDREHPTGTVQVTLDANAVPTYTITEYVAWDYIAWDDRVRALAESCRVVCFGTLAQRREATRETIRLFLEATSSGLHILDVNLRTPMTWELHRLIAGLIPQVHWFKASEDELDAFLRGPVDVDVAPEESQKVLHRKDSRLSLVFDPGMDTKKVGILTRGERSTAVVDWQRTDWVPTVPAKVVDTVGAGDAFTAAMVCLHLEGRPLRECARFANHYAARVCEQPGGTPRIDRAEVERAAFG